jgi:hypothetical protein
MERRTPILFLRKKWNASGIMELRNGWSFKKMEWPRNSEGKKLKIGAGGHVFQLH